MKDFPDPLVTISKEEYDYLQRCKDILNEIWMEHGPYCLPGPQMLRCKIQNLFEFDDSE